MQEFHMNYIPMQCLMTLKETDRHQTEQGFFVVVVSLHRVQPIFKLFKFHCLFVRLQALT